MRMKESFSRCKRGTQPIRSSDAETMVSMLAEVIGFLITTTASEALGAIKV